MSIGDYIKGVSALENISRYSSKIMINQTNVASHSFFVAHIALMLAYREIELGNDVDIKDLLLRCLFHDLIEVKTGDILSNVKHSSKELEKQIKKTEKMFFEAEFKEVIPKSCKLNIKDYMFNCKTGGIEGEILSASDQIDVIRECIIEIQLGNKEKFKKILNKTLTSLKKMKLKSVKEFIENDLKDLANSLNLQLEKKY